MSKSAQQLLERVASWPEEDIRKLEEAAREIEAWRRGEYHASTEELRAIDDMPNVHAPSCFIHVRNDWLIGHRHSVALYEAANEPKELHVMDIPGNYHADRIFSVAADSIEPIFLGFLQRHVPADHD